MDVVDWIRVYGSLPSAPENCKIRGFKVALDADDEPSSSYQLPISDSSSDILLDLNDCISYATSGMRSKKVSKLLMYLGVCSCKYYHFEGEEVPRSHALPRPSQSRGGGGGGGGMKSFNNLNKSNVVLSSSEAEDLEAAVLTLIEATSWMNWWKFAARSMALSSSSDHHKVKCFFVAGARCQLLVAKTVSTMWANLILKRCDAILAKVKDNILFESFMDLQNSPLSGSSELFPKDAAEKTIVKASRVSHDKAVRMAVIIENPSKKPQKLLQFSESAKQSQSSKHSSHQSSRQSQAGLPVLPHLQAQNLLSPVSAGGGRSFEGSLLPSMLQVGGILVWHWPSWSSLGAEDWTVEVLYSGYRIPFHHLHLWHRNPSSSLLTAWGLQRLRHFRRKCTKCCRNVPWNWFTSLVWASKVGSF